MEQWQPQSKLKTFLRDIQGKQQNTTGGDPFIVFSQMTPMAWNFSALPLLLSSFSSIWCFSHWFPKKSLNSRTRVKTAAICDLCTVPIQIFQGLVNAVATYVDSRNKAVKIIKQTFCVKGRSVCCSNTVVFALLPWIKNWLHSSLYC